MMFLRARYGHGARIGYEKDGVATRNRGRRRLLDQGVHLLGSDLLVF